MEGRMEDIVTKLVVQIIPISLLEKNFTSIFVYMASHFASD